MDPDAPPPNLVLSTLLHDVSNWLSLPDAPPPAVQPALLSASSNAASSFISAGRQASGFLNLLPGASRAATPPVDENKAGAIEEPVKPAKKVRCRSAEAYGNNLYLGTSDGQVLWYTYDPAASSSDPYTLKHRHTLFPKKSVDRIYLLPSISKVLVLSESTLHFLTLPSLDPIPAALIQPIRGVITVAIDEAHHDSYTAEGSGDDVAVCVIKRKGISVFRLGSRLFSVKDIPLPTPPLLARYYHPTLWIADLETYAWVSIVDSTMTPVMPVSQASTNFVPKPCLAVVQKDEFLATSCTSAEGTGMGVFFNDEGDPVRGTVQWDSYPRSVVIHPPYIVSLLRNQTIQIHSLLNLDVALQTIFLPPSLEARFLFKSPTGFVVPATDRDTLLAKVLVPLLPPPSPTSIPLPDSSPTSPDLANPSTSEVPSTFEPPSGGSGLTPPSSPRRSYNSARTSSSSFSYSPSTASTSANARSSHLANILILSPSSIYALSPTPPLNVALETLASPDPATATLSNALAPLLLAASISEDGAQDVEAVKFIHQKVFLRDLREAKFGGEQAEIWEFGGGDVRLLVRLYPDLRNVLELEKQDSEDPDVVLEVEVEEGLKEEWKEVWSVEEIIQDNLRRNYAPHIEPDVETSPSTTELRTVLLGQAREMLKAILLKERAQRLRKSAPPKSGKRSKQAAVQVARTRQEEVLDRVVDTSLLILLARIGSTLSILDTLESKHSADPGLVRAALEKEQRWFALGRCSDGEESLEIFTAIADGTKPDDDCVRDPVDEVLSILAASEDVPLVRKYGLWVVKRDWERGLELFTHSGLDFDHGDLVDELRALNDRAGDKYLEHVVIVKESTDRVLHTSMAVRYVDVLCRYLQDPAVEKEFADAVSAYSSAPASTSFLTFLASFLPDSPHKRLRFKTILFIQGSQLYDIDAVRNRLEHEPALSVLSIERAIIFGKLHMHEEALRILARTLRDSISAEAFCAQGGEVVPARVGQTIAHDLGLDEWAALGGGAMRRRATVSEETRNGLLVTLLRIYMGQGEGAATASRTASLLNDQAIHLDVVEVLELIPEPWPLQSMSSFLTRSIRRTLHDQHEGQILKALATSENLATMDLAFEVLRSRDPVIHTAHSGGDEERDDAHSLVMDILGEKEKVGLEDEQERAVTVEFGRAGAGEGKERMTVSPTGYGSDEGEEGLA